MKHFPNFFEVIHYIFIKDMSVECICVFFCFFVFFCYKELEVCRKFNGRQKKYLEQIKFCKA